MKWRALGAALAVAGVAVAAALLLLPPEVRYETEAVRRQPVQDTVTAIGTLQPRQYVDVGAQVSGQIRRLHVAAGDTVRRGQLLVEIDPSVQQATVDAGRAQLDGLRAQLAEQEALHRLAAQQMARQRQMAAEEATRAEDVQAAEAELAVRAARIAQLRAQIAETRATQRADEARLGYTRIFAPMDGTVVGVEAREGQTLNATYQTPRILRIADLGGMTVWTEVSEADVRRVRPGMAVWFTTLGSDGEGEARRWRSHVRQVLPAPPLQEKSAESVGAAAAPATKAVTYTVLFDVDNADGALMPQMTAQAVFQVAGTEDALAVPLAALQPVADAPGQAAVRVLGEGGRPEQRRVRVGVRSRHLAEVSEGLKEGERIVTGETRRPRTPKWLQW